MPLSRRTRHAPDIWPGFVDALAALLMVVIFVILIFTLGHFFLSDTLAERDQALSRLSDVIARLEAQLTDSRERGERLAAELDSARQTMADQERRLERQGEQLAAQRSEIEGLSAARDRLAGQLTELESSLSAARSEAQAQRERASAAESEIAELSRKLDELRKRVTALAEALEVAEGRIEDRDARIAELSDRLDDALVRQVERLQQYRSEFFGRLKDALGDDPNLRIVGDRFVFQSDLLFDTASAELGPEARAKLDQMAGSLKRIADKIPDDLDWILRVDGHTDRRPIDTERFSSNWQLSTARARAIVRHLIDQGIPPERLAAAGFGKYHPLDPRDTPEAYARNRRIEIKLTAR